MKKILIIDDEVNFGHFLKKNLEAVGGFEVAVCSDSTQAMRAAKAQRPTLILLDIIMPGISGEDLATQLRSDPDTKAIPIVFLTALVKEQEAAQQSHQIGGDLFVAKPVRIADLVKTINQVTGEGPGTPKA